MQNNTSLTLCYAKHNQDLQRELEIVEKVHTWIISDMEYTFHKYCRQCRHGKQRQQKARQINGLINEWYLEDMSDNIKSVLTNKRRNGSHIGAFALYGYQKRP